MLVRRRVFASTVSRNGNMFTTTPTIMAARIRTMTNANERMIERLYEDVWNGDRQETADELVHDRYTIHDRDLAEEFQGPELYKALASSTKEFFSDLEFTIEDVIAAGNKVSLRWTMEGNHNGPLYGVEPTGKHIELDAIEINHFEEGRLVETWTQSDQLGLMQQLGAIPAGE